MSRMFISGLWEYSVFLGTIQQLLALPHYLPLELGDALKSGYFSQPDLWQINLHQFIPIRDSCFVEIANNFRLNLLRHDIEWLFRAPAALLMLLLRRAHLRVIASKYLLMFPGVEFERPHIV